MSSPFGHSFAGYLVFVYESKSLRVKNVKKLFFYLLIANAPDLDFIPGILIGTPNLFHHGISHSLGAGILFTCFLAAILKYERSKYLNRDFFICFGLYCFHLLLDYLSVDGRPPLGIPLFWPLSHEHLIFPHPIFPPIMHSELDHATMAEFLKGIFSTHNFCVILIELTVFTTMLFILYLNLKKRNKTTRAVIK